MVNFGTATLAHMFSPSEEEEGVGFENINQESAGMDKQNLDTVAAKAPLYNRNLPIYTSFLERANINLRSDKFGNRKDAILSYRRC